MRRPNDGTRLQQPINFACTFYKLSPPELGLSIEGSLMPPTPFAACFQSLVSLSSIYARSIRSSQRDGSVFREPFCRILTMMGRLVGRLDAELDANVSWDPKSWLDDVLSTFHSAVCESSLFVASVD
jgi:hypothetical protein